MVPGPSLGRTGAAVRCPCPSPCPPQTLPLPMPTPCPMPLCRVPPPSQCGRRTWSACSLAAKCRGRGSGWGELSGGAHSSDEPGWKAPLYQVDKPSTPYARWTNHPRPMPGGQAIHALCQVDKPSMPYARWTSHPRHTLCARPDGPLVARMRCAPTAPTGMAHVASGLCMQRVGVVHAAIPHHTPSRVLSPGPAGSTCCLASLPTSGQVGACSGQMCGRCLAIAVQYACACNPQCSMHARVILYCHQ